MKRSRIIQYFVSAGFITGGYVAMLFPMGEIIFMLCMCLSGEVLNGLWLRKRDSKLLRPVTQRDVLIIMMVLGAIVGVVLLDKFYLHSDQAAFWHHPLFVIVLWALNMVVLSLVFRKEWKRSADRSVLGDGGTATRG
ncbi:MAG: hypothetical protein IT440_06940 [Phycisphaeraceae bacterium]|nr:hypothetical protein [Phycisphaeraceae bacterium]